MRVITFYIGQQFDMNGELLKNAEGLREVAKDYLAKTFGGYTAWLAEGGWKHPEFNTIVKEQTFVVQVFMLEFTTEIKAAQEYLRKLFSQNSVAVTSVSGQVGY